MFHFNHVKGFRKRTMLKPVGFNLEPEIINVPRCAESVEYLIGVYKKGKEGKNKGNRNNQDREKTQGKAGLYRLDAGRFS